MRDSRCIRVELVPAQTNHTILSEDRMKWFMTILVTVGGLFIWGCSPSQPSSIVGAISGVDESVTFSSMGVIELDGKSMPLFGTEQGDSVLLCIRPAVVALTTEAAEGGDTTVENFDSPDLRKGALQKSGSVKTTYHYVEMGSQSRLPHDGQDLSWNVEISGATTYDYVWATDANDGIFEFDTANDEWDVRGGAAEKIDVPLGSDNPWIVTSAGRVYRLVTGTGWVWVTGVTGADVAATGDDDVPAWVISTTGAIWFYNGSWVQVQGAASRIDGCVSDVFVVNSSGKVWQYTSGSGWVGASGNHVAKDITVSYPVSGETPRVMCTGYSDSKAKYWAGGTSWSSVYINSGTNFQAGAITFRSDYSGNYPAIIDLSSGRTYYYDWY